MKRKVVIGVGILSLVFALYISRSKAVENPKACKWSSTAQNCTCTGGGSVCYGSDCSKGCYPK